MTLLERATQEYKSLGLSEIPEMIEELLMVLERYPKNPLKQTEANEFNKLAKNQLLTDINGTDDEWEFITFGSKQFWSNKRRPSIIKTINSIVDFDGVKFILPDCTIITSEVSERVIKSFPYEPTTKLIAIPDRSIGTQLHYCKMEFGDAYEYYKQEINIDNIIKLCHTGK